ncbi:MAG TPA: hypothetical protein VLZ77_02680 [Acidimicrobiales bacterium]|nr:hypothetical protein [Acidimicrobiales bacterium]
MRRPAARADVGYTLVETILTCAVISVVLVAAFPTVPLFFGQSTSVQNTYQSLDQLVLASEVVTRYIHEAVDPSPAAGTSPFASASANAVTFYANTGNANGPDKVVVQVSTDASGNRTFALDLYPPTADSCPGVSSGTACTYTSSTQSFLLINYLTNGTSASPVFTYTLEGGSSCAGAPPGAGGTTLRSALVKNTAYTTLSVNALANAVTSGDSIVIGSGTTTQTVTASANAAAGATSISVTSFQASANFATGTSVFDDVCTSTQVGEIEAVSLNLQATKNPGGLPTGYQSMAYLFAPSYNAAVG